MKISLLKKAFKKKYVLPQHKKNELFQIYYSLATRLIIRDYTDNTFLITSSQKDEGKTHVSINLGFHLALRKKKVLIVDVNPWNPTLTECFHLERETGFLDLLRQKSPLKGIQFFPDIEEFHVLGIGHRDQDIIDVLIQNLQDFIYFTKDYDFIFFDVPSMNQHYEAQLLMKMVNQVLLVVRLGMTSFTAVKEAENKIKTNSGKFEGVIVNHYRNPIPKLLLGL